MTVNVMFRALMRNTFPSLRSLFAHPSPFASVNNIYHVKSWFNYRNDNSMNQMLGSQLFLMSGGIRAKSCLQTNKSAAKRFIVRGNGRIKRGKAGRSHNTGHKGRKRINRLAASAPITEKAIEERMRRIIRA